MSITAADITAQLRAASTEQELRDLLNRARRALSKREDHTRELVQAVYLAAKDAMVINGPVPRVPAPKRDKRTVKPEVALLHLTDWQLGKRTPTFNVDVCRQRIGQSVAKTIGLTDIQRSHHPVRVCHVLLGGDMVEGTTIFPGQAWQVEVSLFEQWVAGSNLIATSLLTLLEAFDTVHVWIEKGNHGRLGRKGEQPAGDNIDLMAYEHARALVGSAAGNNARVVWHPFDPTSDAGVGSHVEIGAYRPMLVHGDEINSWGGNLPAYGILRKVNAWASGVLQPFDDVYMGHFHTPMTLVMANAGRVFVGGSPESDNAFAKEFVAATGRPAQRLNFVDPDKGRVTAEYLLYLD